MDIRIMGISKEYQANKEVFNLSDIEKYLFYNKEDGLTLEQSSKTAYDSILKAAQKIFSLKMGNFRYLLKRERTPSWFGKTEELLIAKSDGMDIYYNVYSNKSDPKWNNFVYKKIIIKSDNLNFYISLEPMLKYNKEDLIQLVMACKEKNSCGIANIVIGCCSRNEESMFLTEIFKKTGFADDAEKVSAKFENIFQYLHEK